MEMLLELISINYVRCVGEGKPVVREALSDRETNGGRSKAAQVHDCTARLDKVYDSILGELGHNLSEEKKRLATASPDYSGPSRHRSPVAPNQAGRNRGHVN
jgi:hypothetical protein